MCRRLFTNADFPFFFHTNLFPWQHRRLIFEFFPSRPMSKVGDVVLFFRSFSALFILVFTHLLEPRETILLLILLLLQLLLLYRNKHYDSDDSDDDDDSDDNDDNDDEAFFFFFFSFFFLFFFFSFFSFFTLFFDLPSSFLSSSY